MNVKRPKHGDDQQLLLFELEPAASSGHDPGGADGIQAAGPEASQAFTAKDDTPALTDLLIYQYDALNR
jgi:hypothetical protein